MDNKRNGRAEQRYQQKRKARLQRRRKMLRRRRAMILSVYGFFAVLVAAGVIVCIKIIDSRRNKVEKQHITLFAEEAEPETEVQAEMIGNRDYGTVLPDTFENPPAFESSFVKTGDRILDEANRMAAMYDYDQARRIIQSVEGYENYDEYMEAVEAYDEAQTDLVQWSDNYKIPHVFFRTLSAEPQKTFDASLSSEAQAAAFNQIVTTVDEFVKIIQSMYDDGYVLVGLHDIAELKTAEDGSQVMSMKPVYLPEGKKPFVLSQEEVCYYTYMNGLGFADRLAVGEDGRLVCEYTLEDGSKISGAFDVVPIIEDFIEAHPDFSYKGARGTITLTGYNGVLGYRTSDYWYNWSCPYFDEENTAEREEYYFNNENIEADKKSAAAVASLLKEKGWTFASHTWGNIYIKSGSYERVVWDTDMWEREAAPIVGETDIIMFPFGEDLGSWRGYDEADPKYIYLKEKGYNYFCNIDASSQYWVQIGSNGNYFRQARRNIDGSRMWEAMQSYTNQSFKNHISDLFDVREVFDSLRPTPVK